MINEIRLHIHAIVPALPTVAVQSEKKPGEIKANSPRVLGLGFRWVAMEVWQGGCVVFLG